MSTITIHIDAGMAMTVIGIASLIVGAVVEVLRSGTPRSWWHNHETRICVLESQVKSLAKDD